jgi:hypothetical protein
MTAEPTKVSIKLSKNWGPIYWIPSLNGSPSALTEIHAGFLWWIKENKYEDGQDGEMEAVKNFNESTRRKCIVFGVNISS